MLFSLLMPRLPYSRHHLSQYELPLIDTLVSMLFAPCSCAWVELGGPVLGPVPGSEGAERAGDPQPGALPAAAPRALGALPHPALLLTAVDGALGLHHAPASALSTTGKFCDCARSRKRVTLQWFYTAGRPAYVAMFHGFHGRGVSSGRPPPMMS